MKIIHIVDYWLVVVILWVVEKDFEIISLRAILKEINIKKIILATTLANIFSAIVGGFLKTFIGSLIWIFSEYLTTVLRERLRG